jgi:hypothetical protein
MPTTLSDVKLITLPKIEDRRGIFHFWRKNNIFRSGFKEPTGFMMCREARYVAVTPFKEQMEFIVALSGSFDVAVDDGKVKKIFSLNRSYYGIVYTSRFMAANGKFLNKLFGNGTKLHHFLQRGLYQGCMMNF